MPSETPSAKELLSCLLTMARIAPGVPWDPEILAERILGPHYLVRVPRTSIQGAAVFVRLPGARAILVAHNVRGREVRSIVAHELGEMVLRVHAVHLSPAERERLASEIAGALLRGFRASHAAARRPRKRR